MTGYVDRGNASKNQNLTLNKFQWGFVQSATGNASAVWKANMVDWEPGTSAGTMTTVPAELTSIANYNNTNDSLPNHQLYGQSEAMELGKPPEKPITDRPRRGATANYPADDNKTGKDVGFALYTMSKPLIYKVTFTIWQVVLVSDDAIIQYVPIAQRSWTLSINTNDPGPWQATLVGGLKTSNFDNLPSAKTSTKLLNAMKSSKQVVTFTK